ncbi:MAG: peptidoglycan-binding protein, partial [Okeania sp. SIO2D1]|nr:peptidoglycan-binding protein [Okeania sp. SIO2D1]
MKSYKSIHKQPKSKSTSKPKVNLKRSRLPDTIEESEEKLDRAEQVKAIQAQRKKLENAGDTFLFQSTNESQPWLPSSPLGSQDQENAPIDKPEIAVSSPTTKQTIPASIQLKAAATTQPLLKKGSKGLAVKNLQLKLNQADATPPLVVDGIFGPKTDGAVKSFQQSYTDKSGNPLV